MPLFGSGRDASFMRRISREMMQRIVGIEIALYKLVIADMEANIYGETSSKIYENPRRVHAIVTSDSSVGINTDTGELDTEKSIEFAFLRDDLVDINTMIERSDIIGWDGAYYQVDHVSSTNYWWGRNPDTLIGHQEQEFREFGYSIGVVVETHMTSISNLNLVDERSGINNPTKQVKLPGRF